MATGTCINFVEAIALGHVTHTYEWTEIRETLISLITAVCKDGREEGEGRLKYIKEHLNYLQSPPFTIQRLCELAIGNTIYTSAAKFAFACQRVSNVTRLTEDKNLLGIINASATNCTTSFTESSIMDTQ